MFDFYKNLSILLFIIAFPLYEKEVLAFQPTGEALTNVQRFGRYIEPTEKRLLYGLITRVAKTLFKELNKPDHRDPTSPKEKHLLRIDLIESDPAKEETAVFIAQITNDTASTLGYQIGISTDWIEAVFSEILTIPATEMEAYLRKGIGAIIGALAHEVAHKSKFAKLPELHPLVAWASPALKATRAQYEEARTDGVAIEILRGGSFPTKYIIDALETISKMDRATTKNFSLLESAGAMTLSTHPAGEVRLSLVRQLVTLDTLTRGAPEPEVRDIQIPPGLSAEIQTLRKSSHEPKSLEEAFTRVEAWRGKRLDKRKDESERQAAIEWLYVWLHREEQSHPSGHSAASDSQKARFFALVRPLLEKRATWSMSPYAPSRKELTHAVDSLSVLRDERYLQGSLHDHPSYLLSPITRASTLAAALSGQEGARLYDAVDLFKKMGFGSALLDSQLTPLQYQALMTAIGPIAKAVPFSNWERAIRASHELREQSWPLGRFLTFNFIQEKDLPSFMHDSISRQNLTHMAKALWDLRGDLGVMELYQKVGSNFRSSGDKDYKINWPIILRILEIPEEDGKIEIRLRVLDRMQSRLPEGSASLGEFSSLSKLKKGLLETTDEERLYDERDHTARTVDTTPSPLFWDGPELGAFFFDRQKSLSRERRTLLDKRVVLGIGSYSEAVFKEFEKRLKEKLEAEGKTIAETPEIVATQWREVLNHFLPPGSGNHFLTGMDFGVLHPSDKQDAPLDLMLAHWIARLTISPEAKRRIFLALLADTVRTATDPFSSHTDAVVEIMKPSGVFPTFQSYYDFAHQVGKNQATASSDGLYEEYILSTQSHHAMQSFLRLMDSALASEVRRIRSLPSSSSSGIRPLREFLDPVQFSTGTRISDVPQKNRDVSEKYFQKSKREIVDWLIQNEESPDEIIQNFELLTLTGANEDTDRYLRVKLPTILKNSSTNLEAFYFGSFRRWLFGEEKDFVRSQIWGSHLKAELLASFFNFGLTSARGSLEKMVTDRPNWTNLRELRIRKPPGFLGHLIQYTIDVGLRNASAERDSVLELLSWKLPISDEKELREHILPLKARSSWTALESGGSHYTVVSGLMDLLKAVPPRERALGVRMWLDPSEENARRLSDSFPEVPMLHKALVDAIPTLKKFSPLERIPLIEYSLGSISDSSPISLFDSPEEMDSLIRDYLGFESGSPQSLLLKAYLRSIEPFERMTVMGYLLAHAKEKGSGVRSIFEAFSTVGIKLGQLAGIWNLFDDETTRSELELLKDRAIPMHKLEILETLRETMGERFTEIKSVNAVLGGASIKTVVEVEFMDGRKAVAMIRRPYAIQKSKENLRRAQKFLVEIKKIPELAAKAASFESMLHIVAAELEQELEFETERQQVLAAGVPFGTPGRPKSVVVRTADSPAETWRLQVPQPLPSFGTLAPLGGDRTKPQVMFVDLASGKPFSRVTHPVHRAQIGRIIVDQAIQTLFSIGFFNADPHQGNFIVDEEARVLYPIDFGQTEQLACQEGFLASDDRVKLAQFLAAVHSKNRGRIIEAGVALASCSTTPHSTKVNLARRLGEGAELRKKDFQSVVSCLLEAGVPLERKYFGVLKGLAILKQEKYIPEAEFDAVVTAQVTQLLRKHGGAETLHLGFCLLSSARSATKVGLDEVLHRVTRGVRVEPPATACPR